MQASKYFLLFCSRGFFDSEPCMKELLCALRERTPIITVGEPIDYHGGITIEDARRQLSMAYQIFLQRPWWSELLPTEMPCKEIEAILFDQQTPIEWARTGDHQDTAMRLIATRLLPKHVEVYVHRELARAPIKLPRWPGAHLFFSQHNAGARRLAIALEVLSNKALHVTDDEERLASCGAMLLYLNAQTWSVAATTVNALVSTVELALDHGIPLLLAHEEPGIYDAAVTAEMEARHPIRFVQLEEATPIALRRRGIYSEIATSLKAGPLRSTSLLQLLAHTLPHKLDRSRCGLPRTMVGGGARGADIQTGLVSGSGKADGQASSEPLSGAPEAVSCNRAGGVAESVQQLSRCRRMSTFASAVTLRNSLRRGSMDPRRSHLKDTTPDLADFEPRFTWTGRPSSTRGRRGTIDSPPRVRRRGVGSDGSVGSGQPSHWSTPRSAVRVDAHKLRGTMPIRRASVPEGRYGIAERSPHHRDPDLRPAQPGGDTEVGANAVGSEERCKVPRPAAVHISEQVCNVVRDVDEHTMERTYLTLPTVQAGAAGAGPSTGAAGATLRPLRARTSRVDNNLVV